MTHDFLDLTVLALNRVYPRVAAATLVEWAVEGRLSPCDLVRPVGSSEWLLVEQVPWLAMSLPQSLVPKQDQSGAEDAELDAEECGGWTARRLRHRAEDSEIDMTPMIDVTFQLLIFFMLTNTLANSAPIAVPEAAHGRGVSPEGMQMLLLDDKGRYYFGDKVDETNLAESLDKLIEEVSHNAGNEPLNVIVNAHKNAKHGQVRELVEQLGTLSQIGDVKLGVEEKR